MSRIPRNAKRDANEPAWTGTQRPTWKALQRLQATNTELLAALKECREGLAAAMRALDGEGIERFLSELQDAGVVEGVGVRAARAIANAEGRATAPPTGTDV